MLFVCSLKSFVVKRFDCSPPLMPMNVAGDSPSPNEAVAGDEPSSDEIQQQQPVGRRCASKGPFMMYFLCASTTGWWTHLYPSDDNAFAGSV